MRRLLRAKALSACYEVPQCPVIGELARLALKQTTGSEALFTEDGYHDCPREGEFGIPAFAPLAATRQLFADLFGVGIEQQLLAESCIRKGDLGALASIIPPPDDIFKYSLLYLEVT